MFEISDLLALFFLSLSLKSLFQDLFSFSFQTTATWQSTSELINVIRFCCSKFEIFQEIGRHSKQRSLRLDLEYLAIRD